MATSPTDQTVLYEIKFTQVFELLAQQMEERIPQTFMQGTHTGSKMAQARKQVGKTQPTQRVNRLEPITFTDIPLDARWVLPQNWDEATPFDTWDQLQTEADPKGSYAQAIVAGMNRQRDSECIRAFFETSHTGEQGASTTTFPTSTNQISQSFGSSATTGFTVAKLREAKRKLLANEVDLELGDLRAVLTSYQLDDLLAEAQVLSRDFNETLGIVVKDGNISRLMGVGFIHSEQVGLDSSATYTAVPVYHTSGMHWGSWMGIETKITQREDLRGRPWQIYVNSMFGGTRLQEAKVMQVLCGQTS